MTQPAASIGSPLAVKVASGQWIYAYDNISTVPMIVAPAHQRRRRITFHNPGPIDIFIAPLYTQESGSDVLLVPSLNALGGCYILYNNGGSLTKEGEVQKEWQAFARFGNTNHLTIDESAI